MRKSYADGLIDQLLLLLNRQQAQIEQLSQRLSDLADSIHPLQSFLKNDSGWVQTAHVSGQRIIARGDYSTGISTGLDWIVPCANLSNFTEMALVMGQVVDYYRPLPNGTTACQMLQSSILHQWRPHLNSTWYNPPFYASTILGGSPPEWPRLQGFDARSFVSFWGSDASPGGCCSSSRYARYTMGATVGDYWSQQFDLFWR